MAPNTDRRIHYYHSPFKGGGVRVVPENIQHAPEATPNLSSNNDTSEYLRRNVRKTANQPRFNR